MSVITVNETFLKQCHLLSSQKNRINMVSDHSTPITELNRTPPPPPTTVNHFEKLYSFPQGFESFLVIFFKISYFIGLNPHYWEIVDLKNGSKAVKRSGTKFHTVVVCIIHICGILRYLMRFCLLSYDLRNPLNYFRIARTVLSTSLCGFFLWSLWKRHILCKRLLDHLANLSYFHNVTSLKKKSFQYMIVLAGIGLLCLTSVNRAIQECNNRWDDVCKDNRFGLECLSFCHDEKYKILRILVTVLFGIINYFGRTTRRLPRMALLSFALTMWQICKSFSKFLKRRNKQLSQYQSHEILTILLAYEELKCISDMIRDLIGEMLISEIVEDIVYFSLEVQLRLRESNWFEIFVVVETWLVAFLAYFIAACGAEHVQEVSVWLARDDVLSKLSPGKVATLHSQLTATPIGMKGGSLFTVTKSFLANVVTVWVTYFIILLQFQFSVEEKNLSRE